MIESGWSRGVINQRVGRIKRAFKWAASKEMVPATVIVALQTVAGLSKGQVRRPLRLPRSGRCQSNSLMQFARTSCPRYGT